MNEAKTVEIATGLQGTTTRIAVHPALKRHHNETGHLSHFKGRTEELLERVQQALQSGALQKPGRLPGSLIVEINPDKVYCRVGEEARTRTHGFFKPEAQRAEVVLHPIELVAKLGKLTYRGHRIDVRADLLVVAVHGWLDRQATRRGLGST